jgi:hypothetical protein
MSRSPRAAAASAKGGYWVRSDGVPWCKISGGAWSGPEALTSSDQPPDSPTANDETSMASEVWSALTPVVHQAPMRQVLEPSSDLPTARWVDGVMRGKMPGSRTLSEHPTRQNRDCAPRGIRTPNRQIRSLVLCVDLVSSIRIWPAHVGSFGGPDGSRRIPSDRLDDQVTM